MFFLKKFTVEQVLKSFSGRNNSQKSPIFEFFDSLLYDLEKSKELRALISSLLSLQAFKKAKNFCQQFFCVFLSCRYGFTNYFDILIFFLIHQEEFQLAKHISRISTS